MSFLPLDINFLTKEMIRKTEEELGETTERRKEALIQLRKVLNDEEKLSCSPNEEFLLMFLRARKFNIQQSVELLRNFQRIKAEYPDTCQLLKFDIIETFLKHKVFNVLPYRDKDGSVIIIISSEHFLYEKFTTAVFMNALWIIILVLTFAYPSIQICGLKVIFDTTYMAVKHLKYTPPRMLIFLAKAAKNTMPVRYKSIHLLSGSLALNCIWQVIRPFLSQKIKERCIFHTSTDLTKFFDITILPKEYGGTLDHNNDFCIAILKKNERRMHELFT